MMLHLFVEVFISLRWGCAAAERFATVSWLTSSLRHDSKCFVLSLVSFLPTGDWYNSWDLQGALFFWSLTLWTLCHISRIIIFSLRFAAVFVVFLWVVILPATSGLIFTKLYRSKFLSSWWLDSWDFRCLFFFQICDSAISGLMILLRFAVVFFCHSDPGLSFLRFEVLFFFFGFGFV